MLAHSPSIIMNGLVLCLDAANTKSYPGSGTTWTDLSGNGNTGTLTNGPTFNSANGGSIVFDGVDDIISSNSNLTLGASFSISLWLKHTNSNPIGEKYITLGANKVVVQVNYAGNLNLFVSDGTENNLWMWGAGEFGNLGINVNGDIVNSRRQIPVTTFAGGTNWKQIVCGGEGLTAAIKTDGTLWTWGNNGSGQLGNNDTTNRNTPVTTFAGGLSWQSVACGEEHTAAIKTDGTLWVWGAGGSGRLGINDTTNRTTPVTTFSGGNNWQSVACGRRYTAAIKTDGTLWTWGENGSGQLGINNADNRSAPVTTFSGGNNWKSVTGARNHISAIKTDGTLWTWGGGSSGQLGNNDTTNRNTPVTTFAGGNNWESAASGSVGVNHSLAIKTDGTLWVWGAGGSGRLGTNDTTNRTTPVTTFAGGTNWKSVSCGADFSFAIKTDGTLWGFGFQNYGGQLGIGDEIFRSIPVTTFLGGTNWKSVSCGSNFTGAIKTNAATINDESISASILNTTYYNIVVTSDGTTLRFYQNNSLVKTATLNGTLSSTSLSYTISDTLNTFRGNLANIQLYSRALTASEVAQNFNALRGRYSI